MVKFGFKILGFMAILYAIAGFLNIEVWLQFKGFQKLSQAESLNFLLIGIVLVLISFIKKTDPKKEE